MNTDRLDADLQVLHDHRTRWARLPVQRKIKYLEDFIADTAAVAEAQVRAGMAAKGVAPGSPGEAEEWFAAPVVQIRTARLLAESLRGVARSGAPDLPDDRISVRPDGRTVVQVFPNSTIDGLTFAGFTAEVWMQDGVTPANLRRHMAGFYRGRDPEGAVALVLGAGNVPSIGPLDVLHKLFQEGQVCLLKFNPVNEYLAPFVEQAFDALIRDGFVRTCTGGADVGAYLCQHALVEEIHVTGSDKTHDAIVYGVGDDGAKNKAADTPINDRRITSELGNVSPVVIVPGPWTESDLRFQAENVATQMTNNGGFNCNAAKVLVLAEHWPQRRAFMDMLRAVLAAAPQRRAYYPGALDRYRHFVAAHPQAEPIGAEGPGIIPWTLIPDVPSEQTDAVAFTEESFCGITAQTTLPGDDPRAFLERAVAFCNDVLWGTLNCSLIVHPHTEKSLGDALDAAIAGLDYGTVTVNHWAALGYGLGTTPWGAAPGHVRTDIQSGVGWVHNALMLDAAHKSVIRGPFRVRPKPPWFVTHRRAYRVARRMVDLERAPSLRRLPGIVFDAVRG